MASQIRSETVQVRISSEAKQLLREAADLNHTSMSEFVVRSALAKAEETLAEKRIIQLSDEEWQRFSDALDAPPQSHARMEALLNSPSVFD